MPTSKKRQKPTAARRPSANGSRPPITADSDVEETPAQATPATTAPVRARRPMPRWLKRSLLIAGGILLVLILAGAGFAYWTVQKAMPTLNGTVNVPGLDGQVTIVRDSSGIPHITATTLHDLFLAQRYV